MSWEDSHIVKENQAIAVYRPMADERGISTRSVLGSQKTIKIIFSHVRFLFLSPPPQTLKSFILFDTDQIAPIQSIGSV